MKNDSKKAGELSSAEVGAIIIALAKVFSNGPAQRDEIAEALHFVGSTLRRRGTVSVREALASYSPQKKTPAASSARTQRPALSMGRTELLGFIDKPERTKAELIEVATHQLGLPHSRLQKMPKQEVLDSLKSVLRNERTLDVISQQAKKSGIDRS